MDHTKELIELAHNGSREARDMLVLDNMGLVYSIARRFAGRGYDMDDIVQIGTIGLIKAIDKFDLEQPVMFSTYAVPMISGEIKRFLRDDGMIKISRQIKENGWKIKQAREHISNVCGREATLEEISKETNLSVEDIVSASMAGMEIESIYQTAYSNDGSNTYVIDKIAVATEEPYSESIINNMMIDELISRLPDNEKLLIEMRYFQEKTQTDVAKVLGISQVQVSRLEKKILLKMRKVMDG